jgi:hypothetical protein
MKEVLIHFIFPQGTKEQYDNVWRDLNIAGHASPKGLIYHVGSPGPEGGFMVIDVWESEEAFNEFGKVLKPILEKNEVAAAPPKVLPIYNIYENKQVSASL